MIKTVQHAIFLLPASNGLLLLLSLQIRFYLHCTMEKLGERLLTIMRKHKTNRNRRSDFICDLCPLVVKTLAFR